MPRSKRPAFLTKQKEQQRRAKATVKLEQRRARQKAKAVRGEPEVAAPESQGEDLAE